MMVKAVVIVAALNKRHARFWGHNFGSLVGVLVLLLVDHKNQMIREILFIFNILAF